MPNGTVLGKTLNYRETQGHDKGSMLTPILYCRWGGEAKVQLCRVSSFKPTALREMEWITNR